LAKEAEEAEAARVRLPPAPTVLHAIHAHSCRRSWRLPQKQQRLRCKLPRSPATRLPLPQPRRRPPPLVPLLIRRRLRQWRLPLPLKPLKQQPWLRRYLSILLDTYGRLLRVHAKRVLFGRDACSG
jgi:hypothetical protein